MDLALLLLLSGLWGGSYLLIKVALATLPPITLIAMRVSVAAAFLLAVAWSRGARLPRDRCTWRRLLVQAFFNSIASWTLLAWGQQYVDSAVAGVLNSTSPIFVFLITALVTRHEAAGPRKLAGALLGVAGVLLIVGLDAVRSLGQEIAGQLAVLASAALYACAAVHGARFPTLPPVIVASGTMLWAAVFLVPLSLLVERPWALTPSAASLVAALVLGLLSTGVALLIYFRLVSALGSMGVASNSYLRAGISVLLGVLILDEEMGLAAGAGLLAIVLGVSLMNRKELP